MGQIQVVPTAQSAGDAEMGVEFRGEVPFDLLAEDLGVPVPVAG